jgi:hypothetical protein
VATERQPGHSGTLLSGTHIGLAVALELVWPTRKLVLKATSPVALGGGRWVVVPVPGAPVRLSSRVVASPFVAEDARWHEDALPLLEQAVRKASGVLPGATWTLLPSADGATAADDKSTYAALSPTSFKSAAAALTQCALVIEEVAPRADIKWIARARPQGKEPRAVLSLGFGEKRRRTGAREGLIIPADRSQSVPVKWWQDEK